MGWINKLLWKKNLSENLVPSSLGFLRDLPTKDITKGALHEIFLEVREKTDNSIRWYLKEKEGPKVGSKLCRRYGILMVGLGGICNVVYPLSEDMNYAKYFPVLSVVLLGIAGIMFSFDRFAGFSTKWMRYIQTAQKLKILLETFEMDWTEKMISANGSTGGLNASEALPLIHILREHRLAVEREIQQETDSWVAEFKSSLQQIEQKIQEDHGKAQAGLESQQKGTVTVRVKGALPSAEKMILKIGGSIVKEFVTEGDFWSETFPSGKEIFLALEIPQKDSAPKVLKENYTLNPGETKNFVFSPED